MSSFAHNSHLPAYPDPHKQTFSGIGLTKRELFAAMAMQGINSDGIPGRHHNHEQTARDAVAYADALLAELALQQP